MLDLGPASPSACCGTTASSKGFGIKEGDPQIVGAADTLGERAKGQTAMESLLQKDPGINVVYSINEPSGFGGANALKAAGKDPNDFMLVSVDGGCEAIKSGIKTGVIDATSQQYPQNMAKQGVKTIVKAASGGKKPSGYTDTGVNLITDEPMNGVSRRTPPTARRTAGARRRRSVRRRTAGAGAPERARAAGRRSSGRGGLPKVSGERLAQLGPLFALIIVCAVLHDAVRPLPHGENFSLVFQQVMVIGTLAIGQTIIILTAGIDLSCGMVMAFGSIVMTKMAVDNGVPALIAILLGHPRVRGLRRHQRRLVTLLGLPPFIVTLGTFNIAFALTHIYSNDETISGPPELMTELGDAFNIGGTRDHLRHRCVRWRCSRSRGSCSPRRRGAGTSTPWATTPRPRA